MPLLTFSPWAGAKRLSPECDDIERSFCLSVSERVAPSAAARAAVSRSIPKRILAIRESCKFRLNDALQLVLVALHSDK